MFSSFLIGLDPKDRMQGGHCFHIYRQTSAAPYIRVILNLYLNHLALNISTTSLKSVLVPTLPGKMT
ncbi:hypothetical protein HNR77_001320 [Paenibacillus sp. JGP012]|nr:hypothetical protein [Paenibacillus sp. JGP012]